MFPDTQKNRSFYNVLDAFQKNIYDKIYEGILQHKSVVIFWNPKQQIEQHFMDKIFFLLLADYPEIFYVDFPKTTYVFSEKAIIISISYIFNARKQKTFELRIAREVATLVEITKATCGNDKKQQLRYLYHYFVTNITYAADELKSTDKCVLCRIHSVLGSLLYRKAVCDGIARGFKLVLDELGIDNLIIRQNLMQGRAFSHEWNLILIGKEAWHFDITWEIALYSKSNQLLFRYYMLSEDEMQRMHDMK